MMGHGLGKDKATVSKTVLSGGGTHMLHHSDLQGFIPVPCFPEYLVSEDGRVYSLKTKRLLTPYSNGRKYLIVCFTYNTVRYQKLLSRVVASAWLGLELDDLTKEVDHKDMNTLNNHKDNLQVLSVAEHQYKTIKDRKQTPCTGTSICGCGNPKEKRVATCRNCFNQAKTLTNPEITQEQIEYWVTNFSWVRASKELGLSDNGLRKRYKKLTGKDPKSIKQ